MAVANIAALIFLVSGSYHGAEAACNLTTIYHLHSQGSCAAQISLSRPPNVTNLTGYGSYHCSTQASGMKTCMEGRFANCSAEYKAKISGWGDDYKNKLCKADNTRKDPALWEAMHKIMTGGGCFDFSGTNQAYLVVQRCQLDAVPIGEVTDLDTKPFEEFQPVLDRFIKSILKCVRRSARALPTCTDKDVKSLMLYFLYTMNIYGSSVSLADVTSVPKALPREGVRTTLASFGDPHLRVFKGGQFVTCGAPGPRMYLANDYITIMGNNVPAAVGSAATVIDQLNITLFSAPGKSLASYTALAGALPTTFDGGKNTAGTGDKGAEVKSGARLTTILHKAAGGAVLMGKRGSRYTMMLVRMSNTMLEESSGLLVDGCLSEIDITSSARKRRATSACVTACASVPEDYQDTCEYDCDETGDPEFATSASSDVIAGDTEALAEDLAITDDGGIVGSGSRMSRSISVALTTILFALVNA